VWRKSKPYPKGRGELCCVPINLCIISVSLIPRIRGPVDIPRQDTGFFHRCCQSPHSEAHVGQLITYSMSLEIWCSSLRKSLSTQLQRRNAACPRACRATPCPPADGHSGRFASAFPNFPGPSLSRPCESVGSFPPCSSPSHAACHGTSLSAAGSRDGPLPEVHQGCPTQRESAQRMLRELPASSPMLVLNE